MQLLQRLQQQPAGASPEQPEQQPQSIKWRNFSSGSSRSIFSRSIIWRSGGAASAAFRGEQVEHQEWYSRSRPQSIPVLLPGGGQRAGEQAASSAGASPAGWSRASAAGKLEEQVEHQLLAAASAAASAATAGGASPEELEDSGSSSRWRNFSSGSSRSIFSRSSSEAAGGAAQPHLQEEQVEHQSWDSGRSRSSIGRRCFSWRSSTQRSRPASSAGASPAAAAVKAASAAAGAEQVEHHF